MDRWRPDLRRPRCGARVGVPGAAALPVHDRRSVTARLPAAVRPDRVLRMNGDSAQGRSGTQWTIEAGGHRAVIVEVGGGLRTYTVDGEDIVDGYGPDELAPASAGQVLAPWPNRIRDGRYTFGGEEHQLALSEAPRHNAIHGLVSWVRWRLDRKSTRLNSSHANISYAVFCLKKKK